MNSIINSLETLYNSASDSPFTDTQMGVLQKLKKELLKSFSGSDIKRKLATVLSCSNDKKEKKQESLQELISYINNSPFAPSSIGSEQSQVLEQMEHSTSSLNTTPQNEKKKKYANIISNIGTNIRDRIKVIEDNLDNNKKT